MKTLYLHQCLNLNTGVLGVLRFGKKSVDSLETVNCLSPGEYTIKVVDGRYQVKPGYFIGMESNGQYRNKGLVLGLEWDFRSFDLKRKGDAIQAVCRYIGEEAKLVVTRSKDDLEERLKQVVQEKDVLEAELQKEQEFARGLANERLEELQKENVALKATLKWALAQDKEKAATKAQAEKVITQLEEEDNDADRNDSGAAIPSGE